MEMVRLKVLLRLQSVVMMLFSSRLFVWKVHEMRTRENVVCCRDRQPRVDTRMDNPKANT